MLRATMSLALVVLLGLNLATAADQVSAKAGAKAPAKPAIAKKTPSSRKGQQNRPPPKAVATPIAPKKLSQAGRHQEGYRQAREGHQEVAKKSPAKASRSCRKSRSRRPRQTRQSRRPASSGQGRGSRRAGKQLPGGHQGRADCQAKGRRCQEERPRPKKGRCRPQSPEGQEHQEGQGGQEPRQGKGCQEGRSERPSGPKRLSPAKEVDSVAKPVAKPAAKAAPAKKATPAAKPANKAAPAKPAAKPASKAAPAKKATAAAKPANKAAPGQARRQAGCQGRSCQESFSGEEACR